MKSHHDTTAASRAVRAAVLLLLGVAAGVGCASWRTGQRGSRCGGSSFCVGRSSCSVDANGCEVCQCVGSTSYPQRYYRPGSTPQGTMRDDPMSP